MLMSDEVVRIWKEEVVASFGVTSRDKPSETKVKHETAESG
jgi:hypothetical protein